MLDKETLIAIYEAGGEFQISVWPRRARNGGKYLRVHIEKPYQGSEAGELDESEFAGPKDAPAEETEQTPW